ncbi:copper homeostasis protein CutC [Liquorilactobacillus mali]|nr:copper homeostasis protein CutC [Liquorilactobacillus mali]
MQHYTACSNKEMIILFEVCCGGYQDALNAAIGGASRIELNSALYLGGLTPSVASLILTKENTNLKVICMVRPRPAGFCYNDNEFEQMLLEAKELLRNGADGIAFGCLNNDYTINTKQVEIMCDLVNKYKAEAVFHRAFDCVSNPIQALEVLIKLGIKRILTSGQKPTAIEGIELIKQLQEIYGQRIEILAGSGINYKNAEKILQYTKINQLHATCKNYKEDITTTGAGVSYGYLEKQFFNSYEEVDPQIVKELVKIVEQKE